MFWKITPFETNEFDFCVMPADTEADDRAALIYAQQQLERAWEEFTPGAKSVVTIELCSGDLPICEDDV